jgi:predicted ArsR family transcriptional regulator
VDDVDSAHALGAEAEMARKKGRAHPSQPADAWSWLRERYEPYEDDDGVIRLHNCRFHELAQKNQGIVCTMNLSLLEGLLARLDMNQFSPLLEIERGRCCVVLRPTRSANPVRASRHVQPAVAAEERRSSSLLIARSADAAPA